MPAGVAVRGGRAGGGRCPHRRYGPAAAGPASDGGTVGVAGGGPVAVGVGGSGGSGGTAAAADTGRADLVAARSARFPQRVLVGEGKGAAAADVAATTAVRRGGESSAVRRPRVCPPGSLAGAPADGSGATGARLGRRLCTGPRSRTAGLRVPMVIPLGSAILLTR